MQALTHANTNNATQTLNKSALCSYKLCTQPCSSNTGHVLLDSHVAVQCSGKKNVTVYFEEILLYFFPWHTIIITFNNVTFLLVVRCKEVHLSTRSGAWVVPNYIFGSPVDHYACRLFLWLPWQLATFVFETVLTALQGHPRK